MTDAMPVQTKAHSPVGITLAVFAAILVVYALIGANKTMELVRYGEVSGLTILLTLIGLVSFCVGALLRWLRGAPALVWFAMAAICFAFAAYQWFFQQPRLMFATAAVVSLAAIAIPFLNRK